MKRKNLGRITVKDIARELGITAMTVSRALNDRPDISLETKQKVMKTAERLGYVQSALGRGLASGFAKAVGCIPTTLTDPFMGRILEGIEERAQEDGFALIITTSQPNPHRQLAAINTFRAYRVAGVIVMCSRVEKLYLANLAGLKTPIIVINDESSSLHAHSVRVDDRKVAQLAVSHLAELGHRRIAHITVADEMASGRVRCEGYRQTLAEYGLDYEPALVMSTDNSEDGGAKAARELLALPFRPTAVFCYNDRTAIGALAAFQQAGLTLPQDMSVVGVDNTQAAAWVSPSLTTVRQPARQMGRMAMEMVLELLAEEAARKEVIIPGELIVRHSSAPPARP